MISEWILIFLIVPYCAIAIYVGTIDSKHVEDYMKTFFKVLLLSCSSLVFAGEAMTIKFDNDLDQLKIDKFQLVYESKPSLICGKFDEGSVVSKIDFQDYKPSKEFKAPKEIKHGLCTYKLSSILVLAMNPYNYPTEFVDIPVMNSYNDRVYGNSAVLNDFSFNCRNTKKSYGCDTINAVTSIEYDEVSIFMGMRI